METQAERSLRHRAYTLPAICDAFAAAPPFPAGVCALPMCFFSAFSSFFCSAIRLACDRDRVDRPVSGAVVARRLLVLLPVLGRREAPVRGLLRESLVLGRLALIGGKVPFNLFNPLLLKLRMGEKGTFLVITPAFWALA